MTGTVGILGASGFVGSALCERLYFEGRRDFVPFIRSSGNAWRLMRLGGLKLRMVDVRDRARTMDALRGCDVVVNCALGDGAAVSRGLRNVLDAARAARVRKFIHLSSLAIYGQDPPAESVTEAATPDPGPNPYGIMKLRQDRLVTGLNEAGVSCYILCPGNITGPYSFFARGLVERLTAGPLPLVDGGRSPSNLIHVDNLVEAILAAIGAEGGAGERYFVNEVRPVSWRELYDDLARLLGMRFSFVDVTRDEVLPSIHRHRRRARPASALRAALSGEVRDALSAVPAFAWLNRTAYAGFNRLPADLQQRIRERVQWPMGVSKAPADGPALNDRYVTVQLRRFYHSPDKLRTTLGWIPPLSYERGLETLVAWLRFARVCAAP